jgi:hypothetical protein
MIGQWWFRQKPMQTSPSIEAVKRLKAFERSLPIGWALAYGASGEPGSFAKATQAFAADLRLAIEALEQRQ